jgi:hypothetical protein
MNNKYEKLVEYIINDDTERARELFHQIVVEKSRDIYEGLMADEDHMMGGNAVEELVDEVTSDEEGLSEDEMDMEHGMDMDHDMEDEGEEDEELEDRVMDLEAALDELKAEFDALMADEEHEDEHHDGEDDPEFGDADMDAEDDFDSDDEDTEEADEEELDETIVREYVERVADTGQKHPSGHMAGTGVHSEKQGDRNTKSVVASENNMGGSAVNVTKGGASNEDGAHPAKHPMPKGTLVNNPQNKPGADAGKTAYKTKEPMQGGSEGKLAGADGSRPINKTAVIKSTPR